MRRQEVPDFQVETFGFACISWDVGELEGFVRLHQNCLRVGSGIEGFCGLRVRSGASIPAQTHHGILRKKALS